MDATRTQSSKVARRMTLEEWADLPDEIEGQRIPPGGSLVRVPPP